MDRQAIKAAPFQVIPYTPEYFTAWDTLVASCPMATFMHTRQFIAYHGDRFQDQSLLIQSEQGQLLAVLPAAVSLQDPTEIVSHPGLSFGGLLHPNTLQGENIVLAMEQLLSYYSQSGFQSFKYKAIPSIYQQVPCSDDRYALFRAHALRYRCDLSSTVDLSCRPAKSQKRKWELKQAQKYGLHVAEGPQYAAALWKILEENLARKHHAKPVHTLSEIQHLAEQFPDNIQFIAGCRQEQVLAGLVLFISPHVVHVQYMASSVEGYECFALHPVIEYSIEKAKSLQTRYFDFGISTEQDGQYLNEGLHRFKSKFGASGSLQEFYQVTLT